MVFSGKTAEGIVKLHWETVSETGNAGFNIYRSRFPDIEFVKLNEKLIPADEEGVYDYNNENVEVGD